MKSAKILERARHGPSSLRFAELCRLAEMFGFTFQRQKGSHKIYAHERTRQIMNFQNDGGKAKAYQVKQLLECIDRNQLTAGGD